MLEPGMESMESTVNFASMQTLPRPKGTARHVRWNNLLETEVEIEKGISSGNSTDNDGTYLLGGEAVIGSDGEQQDKTSSDEIEDDEADVLVSPIPAKVKRAPSKPPLQPIVSKSKPHKVATKKNEPPEYGE